MDLLTFIGGAAAGYGLAIYSWTGVRTFLVGAEQELASLRRRAAALEAQVRAALARGE